MKARQQSRRCAWLGRLFRLRYVVLGLLLVIGAIYLAAPRRVHEIVSVDGLTRWARNEAPPQYRIVWQEAETVPLDTATLVLDAAEFFVRLAFSTLAGERPSAAIADLVENRFQNTDIADSVFLGLESQDKDTRTIIAEFGQMCSVETALPGTIHLITKYENDLKEALVQCVMAGGDSAARGTLVGMVLGAHLGMEALPRQWVKDMKAAEKIEELLDRIA